MTVSVPGRCALALLLMTGGCRELTDAEARPVVAGSVGTIAPLAPVPMKTAAIAKASAPTATGKLEHAWPATASDGAVATRFDAPAGFTRVDVPAGSFGAFLRSLPLAPAGTPVVSFKGKTILPGDHEHVAGVVAIDVGSGDLQQCADSVIRMHAEWLWSKGRRDHAYSTAGSGTFSFAKYLEGERHAWEGGNLVVKTVPATPPTHAALRSWLDEVYGSANTASLEKEAKPVAVSELTPGDFMVMRGNPFGHAVLVLDIATAKDGKRVLLLGQGYMPAQSFHVLRPSATATWFPLDESAGAIKTPFWAPFPFSALRRLPG